MPIQLLKLFNMFLLLFNDENILKKQCNVYKLNWLLFDKLIVNVFSRSLYDYVVEFQFSSLFLLWFYVNLCGIYLNELFEYNFNDIVYCKL